MEKQVIAWRRDFHAHPERGFQEKRTSRIVTSELKRLGIKVRSMAKTGVVGTVECRDSLETIAFRADMDALPMDEDSDLPFKSKTPGVAHMCGHDAHTAMLLGTAAVLVRLKCHLKRRVKLIFQPSEESAPSGAQAMVRAGAMRGVDEVFGLHMGSLIPNGTLFLRPGPMLAAMDGLCINVIGKGGHGASPHECVDPVPIAAEIITALQTIVSRKIKPVDAAVVSICRMQAGTAGNIIPEQVKLMGTVRTLEERVRRRLPRMIERIVQGVTRAHGGTYEMKYSRGYPPVVNDAGSVGRLARAADDLFGRKLKVDEMEPIMGSEDFCFYLEKAKGAIAMLGAGGTVKSARRPHHSPQFWIDESVLYQGPALFSYLALAQ